VATQRKPKEYNVIMNGLQASAAIVSNSRVEETRIEIEDYHWNIY